MQLKCVCLFQKDGVNKVGIAIVSSGLTCYFQIFLLILPHCLLSILASMES